MMLFDTSLMARQAVMLWEPALFDRTGHFHKLDGYKVIQPFPEQAVDASFESLCHERAKAVVGMGKKINLLWSGGADSSLVLMLLHENGVEQEQLKILASTDSLKINPGLAGRFMKTYEFDSPRLHSDGLRHYMDDQQLVLSGIGLDMVTGCGFDVTENSYETLPELTQWLKSITRSDATDDQYQAIYDGLETASGYPCKTVQDFSRLKNLVLCWQPELLHIGRMAGFGEYDKHFLNFYQTEAFQSWTIANPLADICKTDGHGNKQVAVSVLGHLDKKAIPRGHCRQNLSMVDLYQTKAVTKITEDWQYITDEIPD